MSKFSDLMKQPLPSAQNKDVNYGNLLESYNEPNASDNDVLLEGCGGHGCTSECGDGACIGDNCPPDTSVTVTDVDTNVNAVAPAVGDPATVEIDTVTLTPDESRNVDDVINAVATPILLNDNLNEEEIKEFVESMDADIAVGEGFLTEKTIVKFDKFAKRAQLYEVAVAAVAREKKDPLFKKLNTVYKMERILKAKLRKKYHAQAQQKVKEYLARAKRSKSGILSRIARKIMGK